MSEKTTRPPIDCEQWLSLVIALQSHRSSNTGQKEFGNRLMEIVFDKLPARFDSDPVARAYFDNTLAEVAWAVRGFSVVRDIYQTNIASIEKSRQVEIARIESLRKLAPFASDSLWGKAKGAFVGIGLALPLTGLATTWFGATTPILVISAATAVAVGLVGMEIAVDGYVSGRLQALQESIPGNTLETWQTCALTGYKTIARRFLEKLAPIEARYYPAPGASRSDAGTASSDDGFDKLLARAFAVEAAFPSPHGKPASQDEPA